MTSDYAEPLCARCRSNLAPWAKFCSWCGQAVGESPSESHSKPSLFSRTKNIAVGLMVFAAGFAVAYNVVARRVSDQNTPR